MCYAGRSEQGFTISSHTLNRMKPYKEKMDMATKKPRLNEDIFTRVKMLQKAGIKAPVAVQFSGISYASVSRIYRQDSWEDYKAWRTEQSKKKLPANTKSVEVERQDAKPVAVDAFKEVPVLSHSVDPRAIQALNRIGDQLERLADAWEARPEVKKTSFFSK